MREKCSMPIACVDMEVGIFDLRIENAKKVG